MDTVRELLAEGSFQEATVEEVATRAGVSRATLYQHFGSRIGLVDAICDTLSINPALVALRKAHEQPTPAEVLEFLIREVVRFWASEEAIHRHLYGLAVIDPAAADFVERQQADRTGEVGRVVQALKRKRALKSGLEPKRAAALLLLLTSFPTYDELRHKTNLSQNATRELLTGAARNLVLGG